VSTYQFIIALIAGTPGLLAGVAGFLHSFQTRSALKTKGIIE
jgi:hypothetical protein